MMGYRDEFECPYCEPNDCMIFDTVEELDRHRNENHPGQSIFVCTACDKTFSKYYEATQHVLEKHDVFCDECQHGYIYEVITLTPEIKNRLKEIHTKIAELNEELEQLCTFNPVQSSSRIEAE